MKRLLACNDYINKLIGHQNFYDGVVYIASRYCIAVEINKYDMLVYNVFTRELLEMSKDEFYYTYISYKEGSSEKNRRYLVAHWFLVPIDAKEYETFNGYFQIFKNQKVSKSMKTFSHFTILPTMACNAQCTYCYEAGRPTPTMTEEVANDVADYILKNSTPRFSISWFGGEPLVSADKISKICDKLNDAKAEYGTSMISNGYLIDTLPKETYIDKWHLKTVQITLDGTKEEYLKAKNYKNADDNAYERVLDNIDYILDIGVRVSIRMNVSAENASSMMNLVEVLHERYSGKNLTAYPRALFDHDDAWRYCEKLYNKLADYRLATRYSLNRSVKAHNCMADGHTSIVIRPDGTLSLCEHHSDDEQVGSIYEPGVYDEPGPSRWLFRIARRVSIARNVR